jgi:hypothetical protein
LRDAVGRPPLVERLSIILQPTTKAASRRSRRDYVDVHGSSLCCSENRVNMILPRVMAEGGTTAGKEVVDPWGQCR